MRLLVADHVAERGHRLGVGAVERRGLLAHVAKHHPFDRDRGRGDRLAPGEAGHRAEQEAAESAKGVASAPPGAAAAKLRAEALPMTALVSEEILQLADHFRGAPPRQE